MKVISSVRVLSFFLLLTARVPVAWAVTEWETGRTVTSRSVSSSTAGVEIVPAKRNGLVVEVDAAATGQVVWFYFQNTGTPCSAVTSKVGRRVAAGNRYVFLTSEDGWTGAICAILDTGSTPTTVFAEAW